jgi:alpha-amylase/alpha-mannosidase (GH57 family)
MENITLGQKRVQRNFNPSANQNIEDIKENFAILIDKIEAFKNQSNGREISLAQTQLETSCMYAVKSLFV